MSKSARLLNRFSTAELLAGLLDPDEAATVERGAFATFGGAFFMIRTFLTAGGFGGVTTGVTTEAVFVLAEVAAEFGGRLTGG